jgi:hypothetical protein
VGRAHDAGHLSERRRAGKDPLPDDRVPAHQPPFALGEHAGLGEDRVRDGDLPDVVQLRRQPQLLERVAREAEPGSDRHREVRHGLHVVAEGRFLLGKRPQEQHVGGLALIVPRLPGVEPLVREAEGIARSGRLLGEQHGAVLGGDLESLAFLVERSHCPLPDLDSTGPAKRDR